MGGLLGRAGVAAAALAVAATPLMADGNSGRDPTFQMRNPATFFEKRYPGDQAFAGGTVRFTGPEKGPYVERCHWTAEAGIFGLPFNFTQRCLRYTNENTP